jgi:hypothetical protein
MKKVCFIVSHLGSSSVDLVHILNGNPRCQFYSTSVQYDCPETLNWMFNNGHKCRDASAVYGDHLLFNTSFSSKKLYEFCKFIYVIRPARASLNEISFYEKNYPGDRAFKYYTFRLRRICEMASKTRDAVLLTWDDLASGRSFETIEGYLNLKSPLKANDHHFVTSKNDSFDETMIEKAQDAYDRYFYYLKSLNLIRPPND